MRYRVLYHPDVAREDIPRLDTPAKHRLAAAIESRLTTNPQDYGLPLRGTLKGYWKLRVGDYRVVFKVKEREVWVLAIGHRREIYKRLGRKDK